jgi:erythromycin esterase-like protein
MKKLLLLAVLLAVAGVVWLRRTPALPAAPDDVARELRKASVPLGTDDPDADGRDLAAILPILQGRRVIGLGEATHGTREFFRLKDRLVRALVTNAHFRFVAFEISAAGAEGVNRYVTTGAGDPRAALMALEFWTWQTEEVLALVTWMRGWNLSHPADPVSFVGINAEGTLRDQKMAKNIEHLLSQGPPDSRALVWAHNDHIALDPGHMGLFLHNIYDTAYYALGFEFSEGEFRSRNLLSMKTYAVGPAGAGYFAAPLAAMDAPMVFLDFTRALESRVLAAWLGEPRRSHDIDELFYVTQVAERLHTRTDPWAALFDGVLFVRRTTAARGL